MDKLREKLNSGEPITVTKEEYDAWQGEIGNLKTKIKMNCVTCPYTQENKRLEKENTKLTKALEEIANEICQTGCRFNDKDCTPDNCIIRYYKDIATQVLKGE